MQKFFQDCWDDNSFDIGCSREYSPVFNEVKPSENSMNFKFSQWSKALFLTVLKVAASIKSVIPDHKDTFNSSFSFKSLKKKANTKTEITRVIKSAIG